MVYLMNPLSGGRRGLLATMRSLTCRIPADPVSSHLTGTPASEKQTETELIVVQCFTAGCRAR